MKIDTTSRINSTPSFTPNHDLNRIISKAADIVSYLRELANDTESDSRKADSEDVAQELQQRAQTIRGDADRVEKLAKNNFSGATENELSYCSFILETLDKKEQTPR